MNVIFATTPLPISSRLPDGTIVPGLLRFEARVWTLGEPGSLSANGKAPPAAGEWLRQVNGQDKIVIGPPGPALNAPAAEIPAGVVRGLPADAQVTMEWFWMRTK